MIETALEHFQKGNIVIFPTDTLYGIGCLFNAEKSIQRLYKIRKTPKTKPSLILAADTDQAEKYGFFNSDAKNLANKFWPGPLTLILKAKKHVPKILKSSKDKIAIRVPDQPPILNLIKTLRVPIVAPSANFHGDKTPLDFTQIDNKLLGLVDYALDLGKTPSSKAMLHIQSTILDLSEKPYRIVRMGAISFHKLSEIMEVKK